MKTIKNFKQTSNAKHITFNQPIKSIPKEEQETIINISRSDKLAYIDTSDQIMIYKLSKVTTLAVAKYYTSPDSDNILQVVGLIPKGRIAILTGLSRAVGK